MKSLKQHIEEELRLSINDQPEKSNNCLVLCFIQDIKQLSTEDVVEMFIGEWKESDLEDCIEIDVHGDNSEKFVNITGDSGHILEQFGASSSYGDPFYEKTIKAYGGGKVTIISMFEDSAKEILENLYKDPEYKLDLEEYLINGDGYANIMFRIKDKTYRFYDKKEIARMLAAIDY